MIISKVQASEETEVEIKKQLLESQKRKKKKIKKLKKFIKKLKNLDGRNGNIQM